MINKDFLLLALAGMLGCVPALGGILVSEPGNLRGSSYTNPIIHADYSDPDAVASPDGKTFWMTASSFQDSPGLPILKSTDLVNWELVNYAIDRVPPYEAYKGSPKHGHGVWAPSIKYYGGEYYIYWGDPDYGVFMIKTQDPSGDWSQPVLVREAKGMIDPTPFWDEDGKAYLANGWAASRAGFNSVITVSEMSPDGTKTIGAPKIVFDGNDGVNHTIEGPKMYKRDGYYYIFSPAGGVVNGWQLVMRSRNVYGPYESKIVMAQGDTDINGPHQGSWIETPDAGDWFLHFQDRGAYGRITHLNPVKWVDGWPVIGVDNDGDGCGNPVRKYPKPNLRPMSKSDSEDVSLLFQWEANYNDHFGFDIPYGLKRIFGYKLEGPVVDIREVPNVWLMKFPAEDFTLTSKVRVSAKQTSEDVASGIMVIGGDYARLGLKKAGNGFQVEYVVSTAAGNEDVKDLGVLKPTRVYEAGLYPNMECDLWLRVSVRKGAVCKFSYSTDGKTFSDVGEFKTDRGVWMGAKLGFFSITPAGIHDRGWIDVITSDLKVK